MDGTRAAQVPHWWNRDRSSCRHLWYPITGLRRNAPRIVHLLASVLENGASHSVRLRFLRRFLRRRPRRRPRRRTRRLQRRDLPWRDLFQPSLTVSFFLTQCYGAWFGPLSIFVRLVNAGQGHATIHAATNFARVSLGSTTLLSSVLVPRSSAHDTVSGILSGERDRSNVRYYPEIVYTRQLARTFVDTLVNFSL